MLFAAAPAFARKKPKKQPALAEDEGLLSGLAQDLLALLPETATYNGIAQALDGGPLARRFDGYGPDDEMRIRAGCKAARDRLASIRVRSDSPIANALPVIQALLENGTRSAAISYGKINPFHYTGHQPYLVSQISGPHIDGFGIMAEQQSLSTARAVDAWIEKLDSSPGMVADVIAKLRADQAAGCVPPRALIEKAVPVVDSMMSGLAARQPLVLALSRRMAEAGLSRRLRSTAERRATIAMQRRVRPAMATLKQALLAMQQVGRAEAGVWAQPDGATLYAANVAALGDTTLSPDDIHRLGLDEVALIADAMNLLLAKQGMTQGSIGERMTALARDPANQFADSDEGREALLSYVRSKVTMAEQSYRDWLPEEMIPQSALVVKRVPVATQDSAPGGFYDGPSLDGSRPGTYWINLRDMASVARYRLPTLSFHEGVPGHHAQGAISMMLPNLPLLVRIGSFNAWQEGWALYAEQLMAERGAYADDPLGDLGRLQDELFRAVRLVVDTGLHHKRWSREQAIRTMRDITGIPEVRVTAEVERYMAWPAQALGYKLGQLRLLEMRKQWLARKGHDLKGFHKHVLGHGPLPLSVLAERLELARG